MKNIMEISSFDGYKLKGKLTLPNGEDMIPKLVLFVNGSGPNTYDNHRKIGEKEFNYFDFFADSFSNCGIAFFSYNTRGVDIGNIAPLYADINDEEYKSYLPSNSVKDIYYMIKAIKENERLKECKVLLLGWSEGTNIAPLFAEKYPDMVDGLFLAGYVNDNLKDVLFWQLTESSMIWFRRFFDKDGDGKVSKAEYEADPHNVVSSVLQNTPFEEFDANQDGYIDGNDRAIVLKDFREAIFNAIERKDDEWLKANYGVRLTSTWFLEHFNLKSNMELLPSLNLPIYIFHGTLDPNCDVNGVYKIRDKFKKLGKKNLTVNIFENHDHSLNFVELIIKDKISDGLQAILDTIINFE